MQAPRNGRIFSQESQNTISDRTLSISSSVEFHRDRGRSRSLSCIDNVLSNNSHRIQPTLIKSNSCGSPRSFFPEWFRRVNSDPFDSTNLSQSTTVVAAVQAFIGEHWQTFSAFEHVVRSKEEESAPNHFWNQLIGARHTNRRNWFQFVAVIFIGLICLFVFAPSESALEPDTVLRLGGGIENDYKEIKSLRDGVLEIPDRTSLQLEIEIESTETEEPFNLFIFSESDYTYWLNGREDSNRRNYTRLNVTLIDMEDIDFPNNRSEKYFIVLCPSNQLVCSPSAIVDSFSIKEQALRERPENWLTNVPTAVLSYEIEIVSECCLCTGGYPWLLVFLPLLLAFLHTFHVFEALCSRKAISDLLEEKTEAEKLTPEEEVDYWQPLPWDRKCPKINFIFPCLWKELRKPTEPFLTWWRHENNITWIFFPYRHERLSRWERILIIFASWLVMFYVAFYWTVGSVTLSKSTDTLLGSFQPLKVYLIQLLPQPIIKAVFKEIFKLFYRTRRKRSRNHDETWYCNYYTTNLGSLFVLALVHFPLLDVMLNQSCAFVGQFFKFFAVAQLLRLSIIALVLDIIWYLILYFFGYSDLCPYCTDRMQKCVCFNDEMLMIGVAKFGARWKLIKNIDKIIAQIADENNVHYEEQFKLYSADLLKTRWQVIVSRAEQYIDVVSRVQTSNGLRQRFLRMSEARMSSNRNRTFGNLRTSSYHDMEDPTAFMPNTYVEETILHINKRLDHTVCDLSDDVVSTKEFLVALSEVNLISCPDERRQMNILQQMQREEVFDSFGDRKCRRMYKFAVRKFRAFFD